MKRCLWHDPDTGNYYRVVGIGYIKQGWVPSVVYQSVNGGALISQPISEFVDGRFEALEVKPL
ncbi:hypothetical protein IAD21_00589 [Abditibacteriota bacterium]|nr:hypothetical protein IAD21_00589 [Abditibacteriota bacterium]